jgi:hypothetical protein
MLASGSEVLEAVALARHRLSDLGFWLRDRPEVREIHCDLWLSPTTDRGSIQLDIYLDVGLTHGPGLVWEVDVSWCAEWVVAAQVRLAYGEDAEIIRDFSDRLASSAAQFITELSSAVDDLIAVGKDLDLSDYIGRYPKLT